MQKLLDVFHDYIRLCHEHQMAAVWQSSQVAVRDAVAQPRQAIRRYEDIAIAGENQSRRLDVAQLVFDVERLGQPKAMGHDALIGLPDLPGNKIEERILFLLTTEEQVEKLIDKWAIRRQRKAGQDGAGDLLNQPAFIASAYALHD